MDALGEMDSGEHAQSFLENLADLAIWRPTNTKVIGTSRPVPYIEQIWRETKSICPIWLTKLLVGVDIVTYVYY